MDRRLTPASFASAPRRSKFEMRLAWVGRFFFLAGWVLAGRFFQLQVLDYHAYHLLASDQHETQASLVPKRGTIYLRDRVDGSLHPIATDRDAWMVFAMPREMKDVADEIKQVASVLAVSPDDWIAKLSSPTSTYTVLDKSAPYEAAQAIQAKHLPGIGVSKSAVRFYPEQGIGGQMLGFVTTENPSGGGIIKRVGKYGIEGFYQQELSGEFGSLVAEKDAVGRRLTIGDLQLKPAKNGSDIVLTIDREIQYHACDKIAQAVKHFEAKSGSVVIMDPQTGAVWAMCSTPDFDPSNYGKVADLSFLNNPVTFYEYEPGSIFKPITMASALDAGKVTPHSTYTDTGEVKIDNFTIRNSDHAAHGLQTMMDVLDKSLNTGAAYVQKLLGHDLFRADVAKFGFGAKTAVGLPSEQDGDISPLSKKGKIFSITASFGQGITVTPMQIVVAYAALGNGGHLFRPYLIAEIDHTDGSKIVTKPQLVRDVISEQSSQLISAMMVDVVEHGHGKRAGVVGYYVAGKTGTAQVADPHGNGYLKDATIGSFAGYAPANHPKFVMLVKIDEPKSVQFAESSAAPVFGDLAKFLLTYLQVPPERAIIIKTSPSVASTTTKP